VNASNAKDYLPLVQALIDGKAVQYNMGTTDKPNWVECEKYRFNEPLIAYRIKPEPREIWVNRHEDSRLGFSYYDSKEAAADGIGHGWKPVCFREVIE